jgi:ABC-2 type transport system ATP-binding protein
MLNETIIETDQLTRDFKTTRALDHLTLSIPAGIVFGFLGPNGAGKTTTIRLLLGLLEPGSGSARVLGYDTRTQAGSIREKTGALLEHNGLYERLSAEENLDFYARIYNLPQPQRQERIRELLEHTGLWVRRAEPIAAWSRGMKQKVAVARAMLHRPPLIFLDEPTAGLDAIAASELREDLAHLVENENVTVFLTTHHLSEAERLCQQVAIIKHGKLLAMGSPESLRNQKGECNEVFGHGLNADVVAKLSDRPEVTRASLVNSHMEIELQNGAEFAPLIPILMNAGVQIEEIRKNRPNLEEVFLDLVEEK